MLSRISLLTYAFAEVVVKAPPRSTFKTGEIRGRHIYCWVAIAKRLVGIIASILSKNLAFGRIRKVV